MTAALISGGIASFYGPFIFYDAEIIVTLMGCFLLPDFNGDHYKKWAR